MSTQDSSNDEGVFTEEYSGAVFHVDLDYMKSSTLAEASDAVSLFNNLPSVIRFLCGKELKRVIHRLEMKLEAVKKKVVDDRKNSFR